MNYTIIEHGHQYTVSTFAASALLFLIGWELLWKGLALWRAGRNNQKAWFIVMLILNTAGILEIAYLLFFSHSKKSKES